MNVNQATSLLAAGRKTDTAGTTTDKVLIALTGGGTFGYFDIFNEGTTELIITVDESTQGAVNPIPVPAGTGINDHILGASIHYAGAAGTTNFRYRVRS